MGLHIQESGSFRGCVYGKHARYLSLNFFWTTNHSYTYVPKPRRDGDVHLNSGGMNFEVSTASRRDADAQERSPKSPCSESHAALYRGRSAAKEWPHADVPCCKQAAQIHRAVYR